MNELRNAQNERSVFSWKPVAPLGTTRRPRPETKKVET